MATAQQRTPLLISQHQYNPTLYEIECISHPVPWTESNFKSCFGLDSYHIKALYEPNTKATLGYSIIFDLGFEQTIMNIAVAPEHRGKGYGSVLLNDILMRASRYQDGLLGLSMPIFLEVRESNWPARRLYERYGFIEVAQRPGYYPMPDPNDAFETGIIYKRSEDFELLF